jgi:hypothetical protein
VLTVPWGVRLRRDRDEGRNRHTPQRYRASLSDAERIEDGRLTHVQVDLQDTYGPTVTEAVRALEARFEAWRRERRRSSVFRVPPRDSPPR